jgi:hypothetical protein
VSLFPPPGDFPTSELRHCLAMSMSWSSRTLQFVFILGMMYRITRPESSVKEWFSMSVPIWNTYPTKIP